MPGTYGDSTCGDTIYADGPIAAEAKLPNSEATWRNLVTEEVSNNRSDSKDLSADKRYTEKNVHFLTARAGVSGPSPSFRTSP